MKKFYIKTLGCKVNRYESDGIATELEHKGFIRTDNITDADICIINTCTVTSKAGMQSRQAIRKIISLKASAKIIVTGCHAQIEPEKISNIEHVNEIINHKNKFNIPDYIASQSFPEYSHPKSECNRCTDTEFKSFHHTVKGDMTRAYLKIQDGCNAYCSYCIIPYARGNSRSMPENEVIENLKDLYKEGFKEAILTGIHIGAWGLDFKKKSNFPQLLEKIMTLKNLPRIRISSIEPMELTDSIINSAADNSKLCDHFHIPLQNGDDEILQRMERPYNTVFFKNLIKNINLKLPDASIGIDIIAGFPGETEEHFNNTLSFLKDLSFSYLHVFPYSPRHGTKAFDFPDRVDPQTAKMRCSLLRKLSIEKKRKFQNRMIHKNLKGIVQSKRDRETNLLKVITSNYISVLLDDSDHLKGKIVDIIPEKCDENNMLHGKIR